MNVHTYTQSFKTNVFFYVKELSPEIHEAEAISASIPVYDKGHTFLLVLIKMEKKFSDSCMTTPFPSHQIPFYWAKKTPQCKKKTTHRLLYVFSQIQQLTSLNKKADIKSHFPSGKKALSILILSKNSKYGHIWVRWDDATTYNALQNKTGKCYSGHGWIKKFSSIQQEKTKLWFMCSSDIHNAPQVFVHIIRVTS